MAFLTDDNHTRILVDSGRGHGGGPAPDPDGAAATHNAAPAEYPGWAALVYLLGPEIPSVDMSTREVQGSITGA
jgi:hypothetical protein